MSLVHSAQASARGQAGQALQTSQDGDLFPTVRVGNFNLRRSQNVFLNRSHRVQVFNSSTLPADALTNAGSFTDIRIQGADPLMSMTFRLTLANDDTKTAIANLVAENVLAFIDHIDVMGNNGSLVLEPYYARIRFDKNNSIHRKIIFEFNLLYLVRSGSTKKFRNGKKKLIQFE
jgi:hypothetical protein